MNETILKTRKSPPCGGPIAVPNSKIETQTRLLNHLKMMTEDEVGMLLHQAAV